MLFPSCCASSWSFDASADGQRRIRFPSPPAAPGDLRQRAEGAAPASARARRRILELARRGRQPAGSHARGLPRARRSARPSPASRPEAFASWFDAQFFNYFHAHAGLDAAAAGAVSGRAVRAPPRPRARRDRTRPHQPGPAGACSSATWRSPSRRCDVPWRSRSRRSAPITSTRRARLAVLGGCLPGPRRLCRRRAALRRALGVRERALGPEHPLTLGTLRILAYVAKELDRLDEAERLSRRVLAVRERMPAAMAPETARALTTLGEVLAKKGTPAAAEPLLRRALADSGAALRRRRSETSA